jgi:hypothetical protein
MPPKDNMKDVTLLPGVYCIDTEIRMRSTSTLVIIVRLRMEHFPTRPVFFSIIKPGGSFTFNAGATVQLWGINPGKCRS